MKKILSLALALVMMCLAAVPAFAETSTPSSDDELLVEKTTTPPTIDGTLEAVWGDPVIQLTKDDAVAYGWTALNVSNYCDIDYYCLWDDENIYVACVVQEPKEYKNANGAEVSQITIYYDFPVELNGNGTTSTTSDFRGQYEINGKKVNVPTGSGLDHDLGITRTEGDTANEIVFELRLPLSVTEVTEGKDYFDGWFGVDVRSGTYVASQKTVATGKTYDRFVLNGFVEEDEPEEPVVIGPSATPTPGATDNPGVTPGLTPGAPSTLPIPAPSTPVTAASFTDVDEDAWYYEALEYVVDAGLMNGVGNNKFAPAAELDRAMLVTVLWRLAGEPTVNVNTFDDVPYDAWYTSAVNWAAEDGIVKGYAGCFNPTDGITREQVAAILHRFANTMGYKSSDFSNRYYKTSDWAVEDVAWADANGILDIDTNLEDMTEIATRAEIAAMLAKFCQTFVD